MALALGMRSQAPAPGGRGLAHSSSPACQGNLDTVDMELEPPKRGALQGRLRRLWLGGGPREGNEKCKGVKNKYMCLSGMIEGPRLEAGEAGSRLGLAELLQ